MPIPLFDTYHDPGSTRGVNDRITGFEHFHSLLILTCATGLHPQFHYMYVTVYIISLYYIMNYRAWQPDGTAVAYRLARENGMG